MRARFTAEALARSFSALRVRDYRRWSLAQLLSGTGGAAAQIAMAWLVVELGGDGLALGAVTGCMMLPTLVLGPVVGVLVDRFPRRTVLLVTAAAQSLVAAALAALAFTGGLRIWSLILLALLHGVAFAVDNPARQLLVMDLVGRERMTGAVSMNEIVINASRVLGPALAGLLLVVADAGWCFVLAAAVFVPSIIVLSLLAPTRPETTGSGSAGGEGGAWRFARRTPAVGATLLLAACAAACFNIAVVVPLIVADVFHADGGTYGALAMAFGLGALPGAVFSATGPTMPRSGEVRALALAMGAAVVLTAASPSLPPMFVGLALVGATVMWFIARANAFVMLSTPSAIRGRVMGLWAMALPGSSVLSGLAVGALADLTDPRLAFAIVGLVTIALAAVLWRSLRSQATAGVSSP
nr:MFS transporter [Microbacterium pseudoresistens]